MNTKKKGDRGMGRAIKFFTDRGWTVAVPITDSQDYDLIVDFPDDGLKRVQVKYSEYEKRPGVFEIGLSLKGGTKGAVWKHGEAVKFDYLFVATADGKDWLVPRSEVRANICLGAVNRNARFAMSA